jgi:hypothetical protein
MFGFVCGFVLIKELFWQCLYLCTIMFFVNGGVGANS